MNKNEINNLVNELVIKIGGDKLVTEDIIEIINESDSIEWNHEKIQTLITDYIER